LTILNPQLSIINYQFSIIMELAAEYERDFYSWLAENARLLREGKLAKLDAANIAEELERLPLFA
jgi:hypothetical protein